MWNWKSPEQLMVCFSTIYISFTNICLQYGGLIFIIFIIIIIIIIMIIMIFITTSVCSLCLLCGPSSSTQPRLVITQVSSSCLYVCLCVCWCLGLEDQITNILLTGWLSRHSYTILTWKRKFTIKCFKTAKKEWVYLNIWIFWRPI